MLPLLRSDERANFWQRSGLVCRETPTSRHPRSHRGTAAPAGCDADPAPEIDIAWEAGDAARDLVRLWSTTQLDMFREHLDAGKPTRMTTTEKFILWGSGKAPKRIVIPDDPAAAAARLWLWWGTTPKKLRRLGREIARRTQVPPPPVPRCDDIPF